MAAKTLTHEVGAGAPCLKCGDQCPGLDLHFWRKICRICKCKQEDHDVIASVSTRGISNIGKLLMKDKGEPQDKPPAPKAESPANSPEKKAPKNIVAKVSAPPPAPKPPKAPVKAPPNNIEPVKAAVEEAPIPNLPSPDFPPPPTPLSSACEPAENLPLPPLETKPVEAPPAVPPLPEEPAENLPLPPLETKPVEASPAVPPLPEEFQQNVTIEPPPPAEPPVESSPTAPDGVADYEWKPPVSDEKLVQDYIQALPKDKQPVAGSDGAKYRKKQLMRQLPAHDQEPSECHDLTPQEKEEMEAFVKKYREKALGVANVEEGSEPKNCAECNEPLKVGEPVVWAERIGRDKLWHPKCFVCHECKELLVDLIYFYNDGKIYCGRHYCELYKPRCAACDELIFAPEYTQAEDCYWHLKHFCCWHCDQPLGGQNYVPHENQPVCIPCYEKTFAHTCTSCEQIIAPNTEWVTFEDNHWHAKPECFKCSQCGGSLVGKPCIPKETMVFCSSKCKREKAI